MKEEVRLFVLFSLILLLLTGCSYSRDSINVISREDGSGTRDAFTSLFKLTEEDENGNEKDQTKKTAEVTNSTAVVLQTVTEDPNAIGYISMGSLNDKVKAVSIENIQPTIENIKNGNYPIYRSFLLIKGASSGPLDDNFIQFVKSGAGEKIIEESGYLPSTDSSGEYEPADESGKIVINGSSSVTPVIEALAEEYQRINPDITVEVQQTDSTTGISSITEGISTLGMSSRDLSESEIAGGLEPVRIAYDGLALIVNHDNAVSNLSINEVHDIYNGKIESWEEVKK